MTNTLHTSELLFFFFFGQSFVFFHLQIFNTNQLFDLCVAIQSNTFFTKKAISVVMPKSDHAGLQSYSPTQNYCFQTCFRNSLLKFLFRHFSQGHRSHEFSLEVQGSCRCLVLGITKPFLNLPLPSRWRSALAPSAPHAHQATSAPRLPKAEGFLRNEASQAWQTGDITLYPKVFILLRREIL